MNTQVKYYIFLILLSSTLICCKTISTKNEEIALKNNFPVEKFNFEEFANTNYGKQPYKKENGETITQMGFDYVFGGYVWVDLPAPSFFSLYKLYYTNGNLRAVHTVLGQKTWIGTSLYYKKNGELYKEVNEEEKFGSVKPLDILKFIQEKGYINLDSGEGRYLNTGNQRIEVTFETKEKKKIWTIKILKGKENIETQNRKTLGKALFSNSASDWLYHKYEIDGDTGDLLFSSDRSL